MFPVTMKGTNPDKIKEAGFASPSPRSESSCLTDSCISQSHYSFCSWTKFGRRKHSLQAQAKEESQCHAADKSVSTKHKGSNKDLEVVTGYVLALEAQQINLTSNKRKSERQPQNTRCLVQTVNTTDNERFPLEAYLATIARSSPQDQYEQHEFVDWVNEFSEDKYSRLRVEDLVEKSNKYVLAQKTGDIPVDSLSFLAECLINEYVLALMKGEMVIDPLPLLEECLIGTSLPLPLASLSTTEPQIHSKVSRPL